jgi:hypothetical protein
MEEVEVVLKSRYETEADFTAALAANENPLLQTDQEFFQSLQDVYFKTMCNKWRRSLSLKTLCGIRILQYTPHSRPTVLPLNHFILQEILFACQNPSKITTDHDWINWVFNLRKPDHRHALEFVEDWSATRIAVAGGIPWILSTVVGISWSCWTHGRDIQTAFTVAGFVLTLGTSMSSC